jgi:uncharacterized protein (TIGR02594 family)
MSSDSCSIHDPPWLVVARTYIGRKEDLGPNDAPWLRQMWAHFGASWLLGQAYCGGAMAYWMTQSACSYPKTYYRALSWLEWGKKQADPYVGTLAVFERTGGGHVALVVGRSDKGDLLCLGANQSDTVNVAPFARNRVLGYRWPAEYADFLLTDPPLIDINAPRSINEV